MQQAAIPNHKTDRILLLYTKLIQGESIRKADEAARFGVDEKSIQRDIAELYSFFHELNMRGESEKQLIYDRSAHCYRLQTAEQNSLTNSEIFAVCKILLDSRSMCKDELEPIIRKLIGNGVQKQNQKLIRELISNELFHYIEPLHQKHFLDSLWSIGMAILRRHLIIITYEKQDGSFVERKLQPVGILFSEFYFYLTAFIDGIDKKTEYHNPDDHYPTIYRIDRIQNCQVLNEHFDIPYRDRFEEGEYRKRIQFMYGGKLRRIRFKYTGKNVEAVLDRLPTARIAEKTEEGFILTAEVFGDGIDMWVRSQGELIEMIEGGDRI